MKFQSLAIDESVSHGFSTQLIVDVVKNCHGIFTIEDILTNFPVFSVGNAIRVLEVIQELFESESAGTVNAIAANFTVIPPFPPNNVELGGFDRRYNVR